MALDPAALLPTALVIAAGVGLARARLAAAPFWLEARRLAERVLVPVLLLVTLARADLAGLTLAPVLLAELAATAVVAGVVLAMVPRLRRAGHTTAPRTEVALVSAAVQPNPTLALALSAALLGPPGVVLTAAGLCVLLPFGAFCVGLADARWHGGLPPRPLDLLRAVGREPAVIAVLGGLALRAVGGLPDTVGPALEIVARGALPLALLTLGAGLAHLPRPPLPGPVAGLTALPRLAVLPALTLVACAGLGVQGVTAASALLIAALPAPLPVGRADLAGGSDDDGGWSGAMRVGVLQTLLAAVTVPVLLWGMR